MIAPEPTDDPIGRRLWRIRAALLDAFKNTLIILTSNVGTDLLMSLAQDPAYINDAEALGTAAADRILGRKAS